MTDDAARPLRAVIGEGVRRVREQGGARQDDVSREARRYGLAWSRSKVAELERGEKPVSAEELALLPLLLSDVTGRPVVLSELVDPSVWVQLTVETGITGRGLVATYASQKSRPQRVEVRSTRAEQARDDLAITVGVARGRLAALGLPCAWPDDPAEPDPLYERAREIGDAERKAAARLDEPPLVVAVLAHDLWGRTLTAERDRIVAERHPDASPDRRRALRGRVARTIVEQVAAEIKRRETGGDGERTEEAGR